MVFVTMLLALGSSCSQKQDDVFGTTADERLSLSLKSTQEVLESAPNGWQMSVFPSTDGRWGGYTVWLRFSGGYALEATNEFIADAETSKSEYRLDDSNGVSLVFDTYNVAVHMFSQPNIQELAQTYTKLSRFSSADINQGLGGDYTYRVLSVSRDEVRLQGARSGAIAVLRPAGVQPWLDQLRTIQASEQNFGFTNIRLSGAGLDYSGTFTLNSRQIDLYRDGEEFRLPFRFTEEGIELYEAKSLGAQRVQRFVGDTSGEMPTLRALGTDLVLSPKIVPPAELLTSGESLWLMYDMNASPKFALSGRAYYGVNIFETLWQGHAHIFNLMIGLPKYGNEGFGLYSTVVNYEEGVQYLRIPLDYEVLSDTEISLQYKPDKASPVGKRIIENTMVQLLVAGLSNIGSVTDPEDENQVYFADPDISSRRFTLSVDNILAPTKLTLVDKDMPSSKITLTRVVVR